MTQGTEIIICMGSSCFSRGNKINLGIIEQFIKDNNLQARVILKGSRCEDLCTAGPNIIIDGNSYNEVDQGTLVDLLREHFLNEDER